LDRQVRQLRLLRLLLRLAISFVLSLYFLKQELRLLSLP
jgi:hypothetical protein